MAKYEKVAQDIQKRIENHEFDNNYKLPTEDSLIDYYDVSRNTIRSALKLLSSKGLIYSRRGSGFFIRKPKNPECISITGTNGLFHDFPNSEFETKVISVELIEADADLAEAMLCEVGTLIYECKRIRIVDHQKYALEISYYNKKIVPYLGKEIAEKSIYSYLQNDVKLKFGFADKYITAIKLDEEQAKYLDLETGDPGLVIADNVYLEDGQLFNVSQMIYNYKFAKFYAAAIR